MEGTPKLNENIETPINWNRFLIDKMSEVTEEQIKEFFTSRVKPEFKEDFEKEPDDMKMGLVVLDKLTNDQLRELIDYKDEKLRKEDKQLFLLGLHNVDEKLEALNWATGREF